MVVRCELFDAGTKNGSLPRPGVHKDGGESFPVLFRLRTGRAESLQPGTVPASQGFRHAVAEIVLQCEFLDGLGLDHRSV